MLSWGEELDKVHSQLSKCLAKTRPLPKAFRLKLLANEAGDPKAVEVSFEPPGVPASATACAAEVVGESRGRFLKAPDLANSELELRQELAGSKAKSLSLGRSSGDLSFFGYHVEHVQTLSVVLGLFTRAYLSCTKAGGDIEGTLRAKQGYWDLNALSFNLGDSNNLEEGKRCFAQAMRETEPQVRRGLIRQSPDEYKVTGSLKPPVKLLVEHLDRFWVRFEVRINP